MAEHEADYYTSNQLLYRILREEKPTTITYGPLIIKEKIKCAHALTNDRLEAMELALITLYQPRANEQGVSMNYRFSEPL